MYIHTHKCKNMRKKVYIHVTAKKKRLYVIIKINVLYKEYFVCKNRNDTVYTSIHAEYGFFMDLIRDKSYLFCQLSTLSLSPSTHQQQQKFGVQSD